MSLCHSSRETGLNININNIRWAEYVYRFKTYFIFNCQDFIDVSVHGTLSQCMPGSVFQLTHRKKMVVDTRHICFITRTSTLAFKTLTPVKPGEWATTHEKFSSWTSTALEHCCLNSSDSNAIGASQPPDRRARYFKRILKSITSLFCSMIFPLAFDRSHLFCSMSL